jgi:HK97 family phage major capsid protein
MNSNNNKELRRTLASNVEVMRGILNKATAESRGLTEDEAATFNKLDKEIASIAAQVDMRHEPLSIYETASQFGGNHRFATAPFNKHVAELETRMSEVANPIKLHDVRGDGSETRNPHEPWVNQETGEPIKVLTGEQRMSDLIDTHGYEPLSIGKFIRGLATSDWKGAAAEHRAMGEGSGGAGQFLVPSPLAANIIDKMRNASVMSQAGALTVPMDSQTLSIARVATDPTAAWHSEAGTITASDMVFEKITFTAQALDCDLCVIYRSPRGCIEHRSDCF